MSDVISPPKGVLILPRLRVQNANAISSPLTWGFPAPSAFLGFAHALERRLTADYPQMTFDGVGIVCHDFESQTYRPNRRAHRVFAQNRHPVGRDGKSAAIVEEGRCHLTVSLVIGLRQVFHEEQEGEDFASDAWRLAQGMRLAGGSIIPAPLGIPAPQPHWQSWPQVATAQRRVVMRLRRRLLPGFALVHRPDLLAERLETLQESGARDASLLDALLDLSRLNHEPVRSDVSLDEAGATETVQASAGTGQPVEKKAKWQIVRQRGWLVPIPIGYAGLSPLYAAGEVRGARDAQTPFRFVESLYSLGQWLGPHRLTSLEQLFWHWQADPDAGLYRCHNRFADTLSITVSDASQGA